MAKNDEMLALIEEKNTPDEPATEHITKLLDAKQLLRELYESRQREKKLEDELLKKPNGGNKMGWGSKLLTTGAVLAAAYGLVGMIAAKDENEKLKKEWYTASELVEFDNLKTELGLQLSSASDYLDRAKESETEYKQLAADAIEYIKNSRPVGELEEAAEEEIREMGDFFEHCNIDSFIDQIEKCGTAHGEAQVITSTKQELHDAVNHANSYCAITYRTMSEHSGDVIDSLSDFRAYVESHPLKGRSEMVARIDKQLEERPGLVEEATHYSRMFIQNNASWGVIPVAVQPVYEIANLE